MINFDDFQNFTADVASALVQALGLSSTEANYLDFALGLDGLTEDDEIQAFMEDHPGQVVNLDAALGHLAENLEAWNIKNLYIQYGIQPLAGDVTGVEHLKDAASRGLFIPVVCEAFGMELEKHLEGELSLVA